MKLLLDTHLLLWTAHDPKRLTKGARELIENPQNELLFSAASLWEITIKQSLVLCIVNIFTNSGKGAYWQYAPTICAQTVPHGLRSRAVTGD